LLATADLTHFDAKNHESVPALVNAIESTFADMEAALAGPDAAEPVGARARHVARLADIAVRLVAALRYAYPDRYHQFVRTWQSDL
jgi:hypothetical protein